MAVMDSEPDEEELAEDIENMDGIIFPFPVKCQYCGDETTVLFELQGRLETRQCKICLEA
jgi:hypothetical protein